MRILIDDAYVRQLEGRCTYIAESLVSAAFDADWIDGAPPVAKALRSFHGRWEGTRGEIGEGLRALEQAFRTIRESLQELDHRLAVSLDQEGER